MADADSIKPRPRRRRCSRCGRSRLLDKFGPSAQDKRGLQKHCQDCHRERVAQRHQLLRTEDPDHEWRGVLRRKYGLTAEQYHAMAEAQGHVCAICHQPVRRRFHVDHSAAKYLERHGTKAPILALVNTGG
jgi:hypothetical protein